MTMETKIATSIDQSKKLMGLGLDVGTADMYWDTSDTGGRSFILHVGKSIAITRNLFSFRAGLVFPAWSLSSLMNLMPSDFITEGKFGQFTYKVDIRKYKIAADGDVYQIAYGNYSVSGTWSDMINTPECDDLIDAAFEMVCYLLTNKLI